LTGLEIRIGYYYKSSERVFKVKPLAYKAKLFRILIVSFLRKQRWMLRSSEFAINLCFFVRARFHKEKSTLLRGFKKQLQWQMMLNKHTVEKELERANRRKPWKDFSSEKFWIPRRAVSKFMRKTTAYK
jgi:hypothetical protein